MAGVTVSFVADPKLAARVKDIARSDGVTPSQAAARASAVGALLPPAARRSLRHSLEEGGDEAQQQLAILITKAIAQVGNTVLERKLLDRARSLGLPSHGESEEDMAEIAVKAVAQYRRRSAGQAVQTDDVNEPGNTPELRE